MRVAPRGRVPAIGRTVTLPSRTRTRIPARSGHRGAAEVEIIERNGAGFTRRKARRSEKGRQRNGPRSAAQHYLEDIACIDVFLRRAAAMASNSSDRVFERRGAAADPARRGACCAERLSSSAVGDRRRAAPPPRIGGLGRTAGSGRAGRQSGGIAGPLSPPRHHDNRRTHQQRIRKPDGSGWARADAPSAARRRSRDIRTGPQPWAAARVGFRSGSARYSWRSGLERRLGAGVKASGRVAPCD